VVDGDVLSARLRLRQNQKDIELGIGRGEVLADFAAGGRLIAFGDIKNQPIRKHAAAMADGKGAVGERFEVDGEAGETPVARRRHSGAELNMLFEVFVLRLKMLRRQEHPLGPDHALQWLHNLLSITVVY